MAVVDSSEIFLQTEIGQVLNSAGGSVNVNKPLTYFTESAKINESSKNKPMEYDEVIEITDAQKKEVMYGHTIPNTTEFINNNSVPEALIKPWTYSLPTSYKRLSDFVGYDSTVKVVKGDWGVVGIRKPYDSTSAMVGTFVTSINGNDLAENWDVSGGRALDIIIRDNNPSKLTQINPSVCNMRVACVIYKASPSPIPVWSKVKAVVMPLANVGSSSYYSTNVTCAELGYDQTTIAEAELMIRIVAYAYTSPVGNGSDTYNKYSLSFTQGLNMHDVTLTTGAWFNVYDLSHQPTNGSAGVGLTIAANAYVTSNIPTQGPSSNLLAPNLEAIVFPYIVFYDGNNNVLKTFCASTVQVTTGTKVDSVCDYAMPTHPAINSVAVVRFGISKSDFPSTWHHAMYSFTGPTLTAIQVNCVPITIYRSDYSQWA